MDFLSHKFRTLVNEAIIEAKQSTANYKVGAVIVRKNQIIARGHNDNSRTTILRGRYTDTSLHAEMNVAHQLINRLVRPQLNRYQFSSRQEPKGQIL